MTSNTTSGGAAMLRVIGPSGRVRRPTPVSMVNAPVAASRYVPAAPPAATPSTPTGPSQRRRLLTSAQYGQRMHGPGGQRRAVELHDLARLQHRSDRRVVGDVGHHCGGALVAHGRTDRLERLEREMDRGDVGAVDALVDLR